jgi:hypothetical protein
MSKSFFPLWHMPDRLILTAALRPRDLKSFGVWRPCAVFGLAACSRAPQGRRTSSRFARQFRGWCANVVRCALGWLPDSRPRGACNLITPNQF